MDGKDGYYREGSWVPVEVKLQNLMPSPFVGHLAVEQIDLDGDKVMTVGPAGDHSQSDWSRITGVERKVDGIPEHVYDLTVEDAHSFIGNGFVVHNTAAAVKAEFGAPSVKPRGIHWLWWLTALILVVLFLFFCCR